MFDIEANETILLRGGESKWNQLNYAGKQVISQMIVYVNSVIIKMNAAVMKMMKIKR